MKKAKSGIADAAASVEKQINGSVESDDSATPGRDRKATGERLVQLKVEVPEDIRTQLRVEAATKGISVRRIIEDMLKARYR